MSWSRQSFVIQSDNVPHHRAGREKLTIRKRPQARLRCMRWLSAMLFGRGGKRRCIASINIPRKVKVANPHSIGGAFYRKSANHNMLGFGQRWNDAMNWVSLNHGPIVYSNVVDRFTVRATMSNPV
ncbi:hypothetical protein LF1_53130 [Rubripirellula obstinata]|uniref:Uncharacterized protein n=1 Tax=Rubripirellula obstinata TaxID=406547 RepID=A0A5B1CDP1_9BACT|nr:hypothetical protein LF1_53130 [Rubripirellula obstinata]